MSPEQLIAEVKGVYAGLVMVEAKCAEVDAKQAAATFDNGRAQPRLNDEQWEALIALHPPYYMKIMTSFWPRNIRVLPEPQGDRMLN